MIHFYLCRFFLKEDSSDSYLWQFKIKTDNNEPGLAIARPSGGGTRLFLKNTGILILKMMIQKLRSIQRKALGLELMGVIIHISKRIED